MQRNATPTNIVLGLGVFYVDSTAVGLTRDGGNFSVEYEYRDINADGDRGHVVGRIANDGATAKLQISHLEVLTSLEDFHPGIKKTTGTDSVSIEGTGKITDDDFHTVKWVGETKDGKEITIELSNAINLENISWDLKDKDEVIDSVTYQSCYEENATDEFAENWKVTFKTA